MVKSKKDNALKRVGFVYVLPLLLLLSVASFPIESGLNLIDVYAQTDRFPAFQDSYWTDNKSSVPVNADGLKQEVGPGEGSSTLAIVLVNKARGDITAVKGYLTLPDGLEASSGKALEGYNETTVSQKVVDASFNSIIHAGDSFTLLFDVNVLRNASVGKFRAPLELIYSKILEEGDIKTTVPVQFSIPGKVILDATVISAQDLIPGNTNELNIMIKNKGSSNANGVTVTVKEIRGENLTTSEASSSDTSSRDTVIAVNVGSQTFDLGTIPVNGSGEINPVIYPSYSASGTVQNLNLQISYGDAYGIKKIMNSLLGLVVSQNPPDSVISVNTLDNDTVNESDNRNSNDQTKERSVTAALILTAGKIDDLRFVVSNTGNEPVSDVVLTLDSPNESVKIIGQSKWTFKGINVGSKEVLVSQVFASKSNIGNPVLLKLQVNYLLNGQAKNDVLHLGAYIQGEIKVKAYNLDVTYIADTPNLVGNLLNEGNELAMFTTMELLDDKSQAKKLYTTPPPGQYLGDLDTNSPLPISFPINIPNNLAPGTYPVSIKVKYNDGLRNEHSIILNGTANYVPQVHEEKTPEQTLNFDQNSLFIFGGFTALALTLGAVIAIRRKRQHSLEDDSLRNLKSENLFDPNSPTLIQNQESTEKKTDQRNAK